MSQRDTAEACLGIIDRHAPKDFTKVRFTLADRVALARQGFKIGLRAEEPRVSLPRCASRAKPLPPAGKLKRGGIAELGRTLALNGFKGSVVEMAARYRINAPSLAVAISNARTTLGIAPPETAKAAKIRACLAEIDRTPYRHGLQAEIARKHGLNPDHVSYAICKRKSSWLPKAA